MDLRCLCFLLRLFWFLLLFWKWFSECTGELPVPPVNAGRMDSSPPPPTPIFFANHEDRIRILRDVSNHGIDMADNLYDTLEPTLYNKGIYLDRDDPAMYLAAFSALEPEAKQLARSAYVTLHATEELSSRFLLSRQQILFNLQKVNVSGSPLDFECSLNRPSSCTLNSLRYRMIDGSCNNLQNREWGKVNRPFRRLLPPDYSDGISSVRVSSAGEALPSPRSVSSAVHKDENRPNDNITMMLMQWGQFLDHDLTFTPMARGFNNSVIRCCYIPKELQHPECLPISIPPEDSFYSQYHHTCMEFVRSSPAPKDDCSLGPRNQINQATSFLDASMVYGNTERLAADLRTFQNGQLKFYQIGFFRQPLLPHDAANQPSDCQETGNFFCFHAGDKRVNEQPALASMHTIWLREHNRLVRQLGRLNSHWDDERLYQEARRIVIAEMQLITYREFLPLVLGPTIISLFQLELQSAGYYTGYNVNVNPTIANVFAAAVFRFGHSLVQGTLHRCTKNFQVLKPEIELNKELMRPDVLHNFGAVDRIILGLTNQETQQRDEYITGQLTNHLFQREGKGYGMDLMSLNIQRGRDHGLPGYAQWRRFCGLKRPTDFSDLEGLMDPQTVHRFRELYRSVDDIDLFPGGMAEKPVVGGLVGPTFACLIALIFQNLRDGDRFWFENAGLPSSFTPDQLQAIRRTSLARILCDNLDDIETIQMLVMKNPDNDSNPRVPCRGKTVIARVALSHWKEEPPVRTTLPTTTKPPSTTSRTPPFGFNRSQPTTFAQLLPYVFTRPSTTRSPTVFLTELPDPFQMNPWILHRFPLSNVKKFSKT